jgi:hypothetical protein
MQAALKKYGIDHLWHFTDTTNIPSIKKNGLLSLSALKASKITPSAPGGNKWSHDADERSGLDAYVHLAFSKDHPMLHAAQQDGRINAATWIKICSSILSNPNIRYTKEVANQAGAALLENDEAKAQIDLEGIYKFLPFNAEGNKERKLAARKSQILIPHAVPVDYILGYENG